MSHTDPSDELERFNECLGEEGQVALDRILLEASEGNMPENELKRRFFELAGPFIVELGMEHPGPLWGIFRRRFPPKSTDNEAYVPMEDMVNRLPYPLGMKLKDLLRAQRRRMEGERERQFPFEICAVAGILVRLAAVLLVRAFVEADKTDAVLNRMIVERLRKPTDGGWLEIARRLSKTLRDSDEPVVRRLLDGMAKKVARANLGVGESVKPKVGQPWQALHELVGFRNRLVHGDTPDDIRLDEALTLLEVALRGFTSLSACRVLVRSGDRVWALEGSMPRPLDEVPEVDLPEDEPCILAEHGEGEPLSLSPLLCFHLGQDDAAEATLNELFFLNAGSLERLDYVGFRAGARLDGRNLGSYDDFKAFLAKIPTPTIPADPRIDYHDLGTYHSSLFVGRSEVFDEIARKVVDEPGKYHCLKALAGMGKTAIVAQLYERFAKPTQEEVTKSGDHWVFHFCSSMGDRNSGIVALRSLIAQVCDHFGFERSSWLSNDYDELREKCFPELLFHAAEQLNEGERLVFAIDAIDEACGRERDSIPSVLPAFLIEGVVFILSWRVDEQGSNTRVERELERLPKDLLHPLKTANPLAGLTRVNVELFLDKLSRLHELVSSTTETVQAVWDGSIAADSTHDPTADPFYLRILAQRVANGSALLHRPETLPSDLTELFEETWMELPDDLDFLAHRLLLYLAVMRDYGDDELFAELFNRESLRSEPFLPEEIRAVRIRVGKLLLYDGDRYGLFHDRFRRFLVGEQKDPLDEVA